MKCSSYSGWYLSSFIYQQRREIYKPNFRWCPSLGKINKTEAPLHTSFILWSPGLGLWTTGQIPKHQLLRAELNSSLRAGCPKFHPKSTQFGTFFSIFLSKTHCFLVFTQLSPLSDWELPETGNWVFRIHLVLQPSPGLTLADIQWLFLLWDEMELD